MGNVSFYGWLAQQAVDMQVLLMDLYERLERMRAEEGPQLQQEYMKRVGPVEEQVLQDELEVLLLNRKLELIQRSINRREKVDLERIEQTMQQMRNELLQKLEQKRGEWEKRSVLNEEEQERLKNAFHRIVKEFHPQTHPGLSKVKQELYQRAVEAYRRQDLKELLVIEEILFQDQLQLALGYTVELEQDGTPEWDETDFGVDYTLAEKLYPFFAEGEADAEVKDIEEEFRKQVIEVKTQMEELEKSFPFNAQEVLRDPDKMEKHLEQLRLRQATAQQQCQTLNRKIKMLLEECGHV